jgi:hypothetical protein
MVWVKVDDHFDEHPKWADAPGDSIALWLAALAWCNRNESTEGYIPALKLQGRVHVRNLKRTIDDLVARQAFRPASGGYLIHDYAEFQQPEKVKAIREKRSAAGRKGAAVRWSEKARAAEYDAAPPHTDDMAPGIADGMPNAMANECPVPRIPSSSSSVEQHPPHACLSFAIEDDQSEPPEPRRRTGTGLWNDVHRNRSRPA